MLAVVLAVVRACMMSERAGRTCDAACSDSIFAWCGERSERALCDERASLCSSVRGLRVGRGVCAGAVWCGSDCGSRVRGTVRCWGGWGARRDQRDACFFWV